MSERERTIPRLTENLGKAAIFVAVVRGGSFASAATSLGMARSTVSQHVRALEDALGVRLIERTTRKLRLTSEGELLFDRMSLGLSAWDDACVAFDERRAEPRGTLRVSGEPGLLTSLVAPVVARLLAEHAELAAELREGDGLGEQTDAVVCTTAARGARLLGRDRRIFVASPALARHLGDGLESLAGCDWIAAGGSARSCREVFAEGSAAPVEIRPRYRAVATTIDAALALAAGGVGVALISELQAREDLERGILVRAFPGWSGGELPVYAIVCERPVVPARTRALLDGLVARMRVAKERDYSGSVSS